MKIARQAQSDRAQRAAVVYVTSKWATNSHIDNSPRMVAQRKQLEHVFGGTLQRQALDDEELQMKAAPGVFQRQAPKKKKKSHCKAVSLRCKEPKRSKDEMFSAIAKESMKWQFWFH